MMPQCNERQLGAALRDSCFDLNQSMLPASHRGSTVRMS
jgi:hypothetical protein